MDRRHIGVALAVVAAALVVGGLLLANGGGDDPRALATSDPGGLETPTAQRSGEAGSAAGADRSGSARKDGKGKSGSGKGSRDEQRDGASGSQKSDGDSGKSGGSEGSTGSGSGSSKDPGGECPEGFPSELCEAAARAQDQPTTDVKEGECPPQFTNKQCREFGQLVADGKNAKGDDPDCPEGFEDECKAIAQELNS